MCFDRRKILVERDRTRKLQSVSVTNPTYSGTLEIGPSPFLISVTGGPHDKAVEIGHTDCFVFVQKIVKSFEDEVCLSARGHEDVINSLRSDPSLRTCVWSSCPSQRIVASNGISGVIRRARRTDASCSSTRWTRVAIDQPFEALTRCLSHHVLGLRNEDIHYDVVDDALRITADEHIRESLEKRFLAFLSIHDRFDFLFLRFLGRILRAGNLGIAREFGVQCPSILRNSKT